jgi:protein-L-isoaspartate(D-aspartate) O-methyltransferase
VTDRLAAARRARLAYAREVTAGLTDPRLEAAFASVAREAFLGPPPWQVLGHGLTDDPTDLYRDVLVALADERGINNGQPSLHAAALAAAAPAPGERAVHVGAGGGYYTALLATLVGAQGRVDAWEIEPDLAARAAASLRAFPQVTLHADSAVETALPRCDVLYVSAGATHPPRPWLDALAPGGRLVFPLTPRGGFGPLLLVTRVGPRVFAARALMQVSFIACIGARDDAASAALAQALATRGAESIASLHLDPPPADSVWLAGAGWWLSTAPPG